MFVNLKLRSDPGKPPMQFSCYKLPIDLTTTVYDSDLSIPHQISDMQISHTMTIPHQPI